MSKLPKPYYELHVTMQGDKSYIKDCIEAIGWTFSSIDTDIILGTGAKCYATKHHNRRFTQQAMQDVVESAASHLHLKGITVLRRKVELVTYDNREPLQ